MEIYSRNQVQGNDIQLNTTDRKHFDSAGRMSENDKTKDPDAFAKVLLQSVDEANGLAQKADDLEEKMMLYPDQVNVDEVMIASEKARLSMTFFKSITEKALRAYNEIMMLR
jgi:flagellar hook-basal body complex protein FliE